MQLVKALDSFSIDHVHQSQNEWANRLAHQASGYEVRRGRFYIKKESAMHDEVGIFAEEGETLGEGLTWEQITKDWRSAIKECIQDPNKVKDRKVRCQALKYALLDGELYQRTIDGVLLKCLDEK
jgi:hypothetical protein